MKNLGLQIDFGDSGEKLEPSFTQSETNISSFGVTRAASQSWELITEWLQRPAILLKFEVKWNVEITQVIRFVGCWR